MNSYLILQYVQLLKSIKEKNPKKIININSYTDRADRELKWGNENIPNLYYWLEMSYPLENYRLPTTITPLRYDISLSTYFEEKNFNFTGNVRIKLQRNVDYLSSIVLNSYNLGIHFVSVYQTNVDTNQTKQLSVKGTRIQIESQTLTVFLNEFLYSDVTLEIKFVGALSDDMKGFYRSYYVNNDRSIR